MVLPFQNQYLILFQKRQTWHPLNVREINFNFVTYFQLWFTAKILKFEIASFEHNLVSVIHVGFASC